MYGRRFISDSTCQTATPSLRGAKRRSNPDLLRGGNGLLRCARNDEGETRHSRGTKCPSDTPKLTLQNQRAQGTPDAGRTREPCLQKSVHFTHASNDRAARTTGVAF